jgi:hypothetical protein
METLKYISSATHITGSKMLMPQLNIFSIGLFHCKMIGHDPEGILNTNTNTNTNTVAIT